MHRNLSFKNLSVDFFIRHDVDFKRCSSSAGPAHDSSLSVSSQHFFTPAAAPADRNSGEKSQEIVRAPVQASVIDHGVFSQILKKYVSKHGLFDYASCKRDKDAILDLDRYNIGSPFKNRWISIRIDLGTGRLLFKPLQRLGLARHFGQISGAISHTNSAFF